MLRDSVVVVRTRPRAIPLAMITIRKILHGFPFLSHDAYGAPLGGPSGRRSSAITISGSPLAELEQETNLELLNFHCWLKANKLSLNVAKTGSMVIGSRQKLLAESHNHRRTSRGTGGEGGCSPLPQLRK